MSAEAPPVPSQWDANASFWIQIIRERRDRYRTELTDLAVLDAIGPASGLAMLDAGCGEGYLSRALARAGATLTAIDSSTSMVEAARARSLSDRLPISFEIGSVYHLPYANDAFDVVVCNHLLNDLKEPSKPINEFARVLRSGGRLIILMLHPCFYDKHAETNPAANGLMASSYFNVRRIEQKFVVDGMTSPVPNTAWFRPLEYYTAALGRSSFVITGLSEPHPTAEQMRSDIWWRQGFSRPLFLLISAELR
jgi:SAM-dependent methyltransferase